MNEHELVVLTRAFPEHRLKVGDVGTIVHVYSGGVGFEVEFASAGGVTVAVLTIEAKDVRAFSNSEILHARSVAA